MQRFVQMRVTVIRFVVTMLIVLAIGCQSRPPADVQPFMGRLNDQTRSEFQSFPAERQVAIFLQVRKYSRPPNYFLASEIASQNGSQALAIATSRLKGEQDESTDLQLIDLIHVLCVSKQVCTDQMLLSVISSKVESMSNGAYRQQGTDLLQAIRESSAHPQ
jgi:hypothetical protein